MFSLPARSNPNPAPRNEIETCEIARYRLPQERGGAGDTRCLPTRAVAVVSGVAAVWLQ